MKISENEYICDLCKKRYGFLWSEAEAEGEFIKNHPAKERGGERSIVCDDCYKQMMIYIGN